MKAMKVVKQFKCDAGLWKAARAAAMMKEMGIGPYIEGVLKRELQGAKIGIEAGEVSGTDPGQAKGAGIEQGLAEGEDDTPWGVGSGTGLAGVPRKRGGETKP